MAIQLVLFDCEKQVDIPVPSAEIVIGRDSILQCDDKRISRQHGIIKHDGAQAGRTIQITSTHANPIFLRTSDQVLDILTKDLTATLRHGEKFALLPDQYWFEVRFRDTEDTAEAEEAVSSSSAANPEEETSGVEEVGATGGGTIRVRTMEEVNNAAVAVAEQRVLPDWMGGGSGEKRKNEDDSEDSSKKARSEEVPAVKADPDSAEASTSQQKPQPSSAADQEAGKTAIKKETADSTSSPLRPSCEFGIRCYRRTLEHRAQFAHPNDSDYRRPTFPAAPSDAPHCPYGATCYRRNPQHFRDFQHPDSTTVTPAVTVTVINPAPGAGIRGQDQTGRRRRRRLARDIVIAAMADPNLFDDSDEDDDDDDDGDDLFGDGEDSDEYLPGRGNSDEEDDDSPEEVDIEDENEE
ncbi:aprataxin and PNK-like factor isoform X2 [Aedes albopictus]|uniref:PBZ-type domain-containing protein n=1 Tax=Aedes albopictus TaxID=7160 RepID=A0ABM1XT72_AEDAL